MIGRGRETVHSVISRVKKKRTQIIDPNDTRENGSKRGVREEYRFRPFPRKEQKGKLLSGEMRLGKKGK